jgi:hypothetical protein
MNLKIYQPFFISNSTIIAYQKDSGSNSEMKLEKFSLMEILEKNCSIVNQKLYFKVSLSSEEFVQEGKYGLPTIRAKRKFGRF